MAPILQVDLTQEDDDEGKQETEKKVDTPNWWSKELAEATQSSLSKHLGEEKKNNVKTEQKVEDDDDDDIVVLSEKIATPPANGRNKPSSTTVPMRLPRAQVDAVVSAMMNGGKNWLDASPLLASVKSMTPQLQNIKNLSFVVSPDMMQRVEKRKKEVADEEEQEEEKATTPREDVLNVQRKKKKRKLSLERKKIRDQREFGTVITPAANVAAKSESELSPPVTESPVIVVDDFEDFEDGPPALVIMPPKVTMTSTEEDIVVKKQPKVPTASTEEDLLVKKKAKVSKLSLSQRKMEQVKNAILEKPLSSLKPQKAKRSHPAPTPIQMHPALTRAQMEFLSSVPFKIVDTNTFVQTSIFKSMFSNFKINCAQLGKCLTLIHEGRANQHILYQDWEVSHISVEASVLILKSLGKRPRIVYDAFHSLLKKPITRSEDFVSVYGPTGPDKLSDLETSDFCALVGLCTHEEKKEKQRQTKATARRSRTMLKELEKQQKDREQKDNAEMPRKLDVRLPLKSNRRRQTGPPVLKPAAIPLEGICSGSLKPAFRLSLGRSDTQLMSVTASNSTEIPLENGGVFTPTMKKKGIELPDGWEILKGNKHYYYISPQGKKFTSLKEAFKFIDGGEKKRKKRKKKEEEPDTPVSAKKSKKSLVPTPQSEKSIQENTLVEPVIKEQNKPQPSKTEYKYSAARKFAGNAVTDLAKKRELTDDANKDLKSKKKKRGEQKDVEASIKALTSTLPPFDLRKVPNPDSAEVGGWLTSKIMFLSSLTRQSAQKSNSNAARRETKISMEKKSTPALPAKNIEPVTKGETPIVVDEIKTVVTPVIEAEPEPPLEEKPEKVSVYYSEGCNAIIDLPLWRERHFKRLAATAAAAAAPTTTTSMSDCTKSSTAMQSPAAASALPNLKKLHAKAEASAQRLKYFTAHPNEVRAFEIPPGISKVTLSDGEVEFRCPDGIRFKQLSHARDHLELGDEEQGNAFAERWL